MKTKVILGLSVIVIIVLGVLGGTVIGKKYGKVEGSAVIGNQTFVKTDTEVGSMDTKTFGDSATGKIEAGGLSNDGTHKLIRDGGPSQTVYLISSIVDLDQFVGKTVQIWGQTIKAQKAAWLMDVGRVKIVQ